MAPVSFAALGASDGRFASPRYFTASSQRCGWTGLRRHGLWRKQSQAALHDAGDAIRDRIAAYRTMNGLPETESVPADAVTASGNGLDPHISVRNAFLQAARVARIRGLDPAGAGSDSPAHGIPVPAFLGEPGVNVLTSTGLSTLREVAEGLGIKRDPAGWEMRLSSMG